MSAGLAEHLRSTEKWWMTTYGHASGKDMEWCKWVAYERWLNGKALLMDADPPTPWYRKQESP